MEFKKASMVELHNSNVIIHTDNYSDAVIGWAEFAGENEEFYIEGDTLSTLLQMVGVTVQSVRDGNHNLSMKGLDFPIKRRKQVIGHGYSARKIIDLEVKIEKSDIIHIRYVTQWDDDGKKINYTQELVYSGSYSVWWPYNENNEVEVTV